MEPVDMGEHHLAEPISVTALIPNFPAAAAVIPTAEPGLESAAAAGRGRLARQTAIIVLAKLINRGIDKEGQRSGDGSVERRSRRHATIRTAMQVEAIRR
jgi:hypothetical protein